VRRPRCSIASAPDVRAGDDPGRGQEGRSIGAVMRPVSPAARMGAASELGASAATARPPYAAPLPPSRTRRLRPRDTMPETHPDLIAMHLRGGPSHRLGTAHGRDSTGSPQLDGGHAHDRWSPRPGSDHPGSPGRAGSRPHRSRAAGRGALPLSLDDREARGAGRPGDGTAGLALARGGSRPGPRRGRADGAAARGEQAASSGRRPDGADRDGGRARGFDARDPHARRPGRRCTSRRRLRCSRATCWSRR